MTFATRLESVTAARGRFCVGIDPHPQLLSAWGLPDDADGLGSFVGTVVDALADQVAVFKPQSAFFERHGSRGIAVLERAIADARSAGALVLLDVKRGDVGSTMRAYADAYASPTSPLFADAITATPYLGFESLRPLLDRAHANGTGVFVVTLTSNPEGGDVQRARPAAHGADSASSTVAAAMLDRVREENAARGGAADVVGGGGRASGRTRGGGNIGVVIGATVPDVPGNPSVGGPILVPGIGAQGGVPTDLPRLFGAALPMILPSASRSILDVGPDKRRLSDATKATIDTIETIFAN